MAAKKQKPINKTETVDAYMESLDHPLKAEVGALRDIIKGANPNITEHIKWNAPSFCYNGEDRVTFNLHAKDRIQLVFHRGAKAKASEGFTFSDSTGLLEWVANDRALVKLQSMQDVMAKRAALATLVDVWMRSTAHED